MLPNLLEFIMESNYNKICDLLIDCNKKELTELLAKINILLLNKNKNSEHRISMEKLYNSLAVQIKIRTGVKILPYYAVIKNINYTKKLDEIVQYLKWFKKRNKLHVLEADIYNVFARLLTDKYADKPIIYILNCYMEFETLLNNAYPDYMRNGLVYLIFQ
jgi:hypothetical protein